MGKTSRTISVYYFLSAVSKFGTSFVFATYVTFLLSRGLNLLDVNMVNMAYFVTILVAEIPTGAIADVYGRKISYLFSSLLLAAGFFIYGSSGSLLGFIAAEITAAVGATCESGAYQAWLVDSLKHEGYKKPLNNIFARETAISTVASICAAIIGSVLADINPVLPWYCGGSVMIVSSILTLLLMKEEYFVRGDYKIKEKFTEMKQTVKASISFAIKDKTVRFILLLGTLQYFAIQAPNMQWQPLYLGITGKHTMLGWIWAGIALLSALGGMMSLAVLKRVDGDEKRALVASQISIGIGVALAGAFRLLPISLTIFLLHEIARGVFKPLHDVYLNDNIPSKERATIISCGSIFRHFGGIFGLLFSGFVALKTSIPTTWIISGTVLVIGTLIIAKNGKKH